jgi:hypothetical protein
MANEISAPAIQGTESAIHIIRGALARSQYEISLLNGEPFDKVKEFIPHGAGRGGSAHRR